MYGSTAETYVRTIPNRHSRRFNTLATLYNFMWCGACVRLDEYKPKTLSKIVRFFYIFFSVALCCLYSKVFLHALWKYMSIKSNWDKNFNLYMDRFPPAVHLNPPTILYRKPYGITPLWFHSSAICGTDGSMWSLLSARVLVGTCPDARSPPEDAWSGDSPNKTSNRGNTRV